MTRNTPSKADPAVIADVFRRAARLVQASGQTALGPNVVAPIAAVAGVVAPTDEMAYALAVDSMAELARHLRYGDADPARMLTVWSGSRNAETIAVRLEHAADALEAAAQPSGGE